MGVMAFAISFLRAVITQRGLSFWVSLGATYFFQIGLWSEYAQIKATLIRWGVSMPLPEIPSIWWWCIPAVAWLLGALILQETKRNMFRARLKFSAPRVEDFELHFNNYAPTPAGKIAYRTQYTSWVSLVTIDVSNCPYDMTDGRPVERAFAKVQVFDADTGKRTTEVEYPRWTQNPTPALSTSPSDYMPDEWKYRVLEPTADRNSIDLVLKYIEEANASGFQSSNQLRPSWYNDRLQIPPGRYDVRVIVSGRGLQRPGESWIRLENPGKDKPLIATQLKHAPARSYIP